MATNSLTLYPDEVTSLDQAMPILGATKPLFETRGLHFVEVAWKGLLSDLRIDLPGDWSDPDLLIVPMVFGFFELKRQAMSPRHLAYTGHPVRAADQFRGAVRAVGEFAQLLGLPVVVASGRNPRS